MDPRKERKPRNQVARTYSAEPMDDTGTEIKEGSNVDYGMQDKTTVAPHSVAPETMRRDEILQPTMQQQEGLAHFQGTNPIASHSVAPETMRRDEMLQPTMKQQGRLEHETSQGNSRWGKIKGYVSDKVNDWRSGSSTKETEKTKISRDIKPHQRVVERTSSGRGDNIAALQAGAPGDMSITKSDIQVITKQKNVYLSSQSHECHDIKLEQGKVVNSCLRDPILTWNVHDGTERTCKLVVEIKDIWKISYYKTRIHDHHKKEHTICSLPCGKKFEVSLTRTIMKDYQEVPFKSSKVFKIRPGIPDNLRIDSREAGLLYGEQLWFCWDPSDGADKYLIQIFDMKSKLFKTEETKRTTNLDLIKVEIPKGKNYQFLVIAMTDDGNLETHSQKTILFVGGKKSPKNLKVDLQSENNTVFVSWDSPDKKPDKYEVQALTERDDPKVSTVQSTKATFNDLRHGTTYNFQVCAIYGEEKSDWIHSLPVKTDSCNIEVKNFQVDCTDSVPTSIKCQWGEDPNSKGYKMKVIGDNYSQSITLDEETTQYTITDLQPVTKFRICIKGREEKGYGRYTAAKEISTGMGRAKHKSITQQKEGILVQFEPAPNAQRHEVCLFGDEKVDSVPKSTYNGEVFFCVVAYNCKFYAIIKPIYNGQSGPETPTPEILTVPDKPFVSKFHFEVDEKQASSGFILSWDNEQKYEEHEVLIECCDFEDELCLMRVEDKINEIKYRCLHEGCAYRVAIRAKNQSGFGDWSLKKIFKTAPAKVEGLCCYTADKKIIRAEWDTVKYAEKYEAVLYEGESELETQVTNLSKITFDTAFEYGSVYHCTVSALNTSGRGDQVESSKFYTPLTPPTDVSCTMEGDVARITWKPSKGMTSAKLLIEDSGLVSSSHITKELHWITPPLRLGETYQVKVWGRTRHNISKLYNSTILITAPAKISVHQNKHHPETRVNITIVSEHIGSFSVTTIGGDGGTITTDQHSITMKNLKPATDYIFSVASIYPDDKTKTDETCSLPITTVPAQVTNLTCKPKQGEPSKILEWDSCGNNSIQYHIYLRKNSEPQWTLTTYETFFLLPYLEPGMYEVQVSAGAGIKSSLCQFLVPESPKISVKVCSSKSVLASCTFVEQAHSYVFTISHGNEKPKPMKCDETELWIGNNEFEFNLGVKYTISVQAQWKEHLSAPTKQVFIVGLHPPMNLSCVLDRENPKHKANFSWQVEPEVKMSQIQLIDSEDKVLATEVMDELEWNYAKLKPNKTYKVIVSPGDGLKFYPQIISTTFTTAPDAPSKVLCRPNYKKPETCIDVEIICDYKGSFLISYFVANQEENNEEKTLVTKKKWATISGLTPGQRYNIFAECVFEDFKMEKTLGVPYKQS